MQEIQLKQVQRSLAFFDAVGIKYKLIAPDGQEFGTLQVQPLKTKAERRHPHGEMSKWYRNQFDFASGIGQVQTIQAGQYTREEIRGGICAMLTKAWGKGTYTTNLTATAVEVMRTA